MSKNPQMFVDGRWTDAVSGNRFDTYNPATGAVIGSVPTGSPADVDLAVAAARRAFDDGPWGTRLAERDRSHLLLELASLVRRDREALARLETLNCGKPIAEARYDVDEVAYTFEYYAGWANKISGDVPPIGRDAMSIIVREPVGVAGLIVAWNYPLLLASWKMAPALAAGCTVVVKPAEQTPLTTLELARLVEEAGFPPGVVNVVTGDGPGAGAPLVAHGQVDKISFTGSRGVGIAVARSAADTLKRVTLELGGKSPNIVFADAAFRQAMDGSCAGIFGNQGEICSAGSRVFVERTIYDNALSAMVEQGHAVRVGDGLDPETTMGPLVSAEQRDRVTGYLEIGEREGAKMALSAPMPSDEALSTGYFVPPTIFYDVTNDMAIAREEIFGPVMSVIPFQDTDDVIRQANDTEYGLAAAIWTQDIQKALRTAKALRAGTVWINDAQISPVEASWGGYKQSGYGRELGPYALDAYLERKQIYINTDERSAGQRAD